MSKFSPNQPHLLKYARIEEERRFLVKVLPNDLDLDAEYMWIIDRYLTGTRLRLRRMESEDGSKKIYKFGQKYRSAGLPPYQTVMTNIYLDENEYESLSVLGGATLIKRRYPYEHAGYNYSLDIYSGHLEGLKLAEIEAVAGQQITLLSTPEFALREVTNDPFFYGGNLAELSTVDFQEWLAAS